jgi:predicted acylesterase/phospholipase RssA
MAQKVRIQLAIQGGGAKIIGLVAAMEVLQRIEAAGDIEVTRLAGTSAGAIVAALYSARVNMGQLRLSLGTGELRTLFENYGKPELATIINKLIAGSPACDPEPIRDFLRGLLQGVQKQYVKDLQPEVQIISANVSRSSKYDHWPGETLLEALMSSSAIPFVFRVWDTRRQPGSSSGLAWLRQRIPGPWRRTGNPADAQADTDSQRPLLVDGGICENLPIGNLLKDEYQYGPVVAITFSTGKYYRPVNILGFGKAVMDTAIDNSVHRARSLLPTSAIFEIGQWFPISTLDFAEAIEAAGSVAQPGQAYVTVSKQAEEFFQRYIQRRRDGNPATSYDPWRSDDATVRKVLEANWHVCSMFCRTKFRFDHISMVVTLFESPETDRLALQFRFSVLAEPMIALRLSVMNTINKDYLGRTSWTVRTVANPPQDIQTTAVPIKNPGDPESRWIALYFDPPLPANSGPYEIEIIDYADTILADLKTSQKDTLQFTPLRATGMTEYAEFAVVYPKTLKLSSEVQPAYQNLTNSEFTARQDKDRFRGTLPHDRYDVTGFRLTNIPEAKSGIIIHLNN